MSAKKTTASPMAIPAEGFKFLAMLEKNNNKAWFDEHRADYQQHLLDPLKIMVMALGPRLEKKIPGLKYDPRVNGSIFRINRDTRFSKDKRPYKTNAGVFFWAGGAEKMACPGVYIHLEAKRVMMGAGIYMIATEHMDRYRKFVASSGGLLAKAVAKAGAHGFEIGGESLKRVPSGYPQDHKYGDYLKMKGFWVHKGYPSERLTQGDLPQWIAGELTPAIDVVKVLVKALF